MVSLNNLQTCLVCLWQHKEDYSKLSGDVNKNKSIDGVWNGTLYVRTYLNPVFFTPLRGNLFCNAILVIACWIFKSLVEEELKWCSYQLLNEIPAPQLHRESSETRFLTSDAQDSLASLWRDGAHTCVLAEKLLN